MRVDYFQLIKPIMGVIFALLEVDVTLGVGCGLKKTGLVYLLNLFGGKGGEGVVCLSVCGLPLDDQVNGCSVDGGFFSHMV